MKGRMWKPVRILSSGGKGMETLFCSAPSQGGDIPARDKDTAYIQERVSDPHKSSALRSRESQGKSH